MRTNAETTDDEIDAGWSELQRQRRLQRRKLDHRANRKAHHGGHPDRKSWRSSPATEAQLEALRLLASENGRTFKTTITRGEAWRRISESEVTVSAGLKARSAPPWWTPPGSS